MLKLLGPVYVVLIHIIPFLIAAIPVVLPAGWLWKTMALSAAPVVHAITFLVVAGLLSRPFRTAIHEGTFQRDLRYPDYARRRLHTSCWTSVYYSSYYPLYLSVPMLKVLMFRMFGYQGSLDFTVYPDTWLRDLPILRISKGAYISNKATIGTNMPLQNGKILVEAVEVGEGALVGHLTMIGAGTRLGEHCEVSHGTACGVRVVIGARSFVGGNSVIEHTARIGDDVYVGHLSFIGLGARISNGIILPSGALVPRRARIKTQADADRCVSSESICVETHRRRTAKTLSDCTPRSSKADQ